MNSLSESSVYLTGFPAVCAETMEIATKKPTANNLKHRKSIITASQVKPAKSRRYLLCAYQKPVTKSREEKCGLRWFDTAFNSERELHVRTSWVFQIQSCVEPPHSTSH